jgi:formylglycine-generating enzyme required for sulfatase activity
MSKVRRIGKYEILDELGRGGFAVVYRARDAQMGRDVALKVISGPLAQEREFVERFQQEARVAADLHHPNIVPVHDFGESDGALYLAMALIGQGRTLRDLLAEQGPLPLEQALPILAQLADALDYLHHRDPPLVHRDVKPANLLLEPRGEGSCISPSEVWAVLTDFGLVRSLQASTKLTRNGTALGTPAYMAPEQAEPERWGEVTPLTDVYALGVVAYEMLVGRPPFVGEIATVLHAHAYAEPPSPLEAVPGLGDDLAGVLLRALAKPPAERHPGAGEFVRTLRETAEARTRREQQQSELAHLLEQARQARQAGDWLKVQACCVQAMGVDRNQPDLLALMVEATAGLQREGAEEGVRRQRALRYEEGEQALAAGDWAAAVAAFEEVSAGNPDFRQVQAFLAQARDELQRAQWYDEAIAHGEAQRWAEACRLWVNVLRGRLDYRGGDAAGRLLEAVEGLLKQFQTANAAVKRAAKEKDTLIARVAELEARPQEARPASPPVRQELARSRAKADTAGSVAPAGDRWRNPKDGKEMVRVPAGKFLYGDDKKEMELPEFLIDKAPVTNAEYARFVAETGHKPPEHWKGKTPPKKIADHPVVNVSWDDATAYAGWAGGRLPTEQEWEKAARGTDGREYPWGDWAEVYCNSQEAGNGGTTPVGKYSPQGDSPYGCVDMAGNVWEWTASDYGQGGRVVRGGAFSNGGGYARCACRYSYAPNLVWNSSGFRVVVSRAPG